MACLIMLATPLLASALQSNNYRLDESTLGQGGVPESESANYKGSSSTGDLGVGESNSTNFGFEGGSVTPDQPRLAFEVTDGTVDFPTFSADTPAMGESTFTVLNYTTFGYAVFIIGDGPTNDGHEIAPMATPDVSTPGFEQFGINLVSNAVPEVIGANPVHGHFAFGDAGPDYDTANNYKYSSGDMIASAPRSSGQTDYTISYLVNVARLTPGGQYTSDLSLVVVGTY